MTAYEVFSCLIHRSSKMKVDQGGSLHIHGLREEIPDWLANHVKTHKDEIVRMVLEAEEV